MRGLVGFIAFILIISLIAKAIYHYNGECCSEIYTVDNTITYPADTTAYIGRTALDTLNSK